MKANLFLSMLAAAAWLSFAHVSSAQLSNGDFEASPAGAGWSVQAPSNWTAAPFMPNGKVEFPTSGGRPGGYALIHSPFFDEALPDPHPPTEGTVLQHFPCGQTATAQRCLLMIDYRLDLREGDPASGRVRLRVNGQVLYVSPPAISRPWTTVALDVPCRTEETLLELCLQVDAGNNAWEAGFDNVRIQCEPPPRLRISPFIEGGVLLQVEGSALATHTIETSSNLLDWAELVTLQPGPGGSASFVDRSAATHEFYRDLATVPQPPSTAVIRVFPPGASPGKAIYLVTEELVPPERLLTVEIGGVAVPAHRLDSDNGFQALVPDLPPGPALVRVREAGKGPGPARQMTILPAPNQVLELAFENNQVLVMGRQVRGGEASRPAPRSQPRLSLDLLDATGALVASSSLPHPRLFDPEMLGGTGPSDALFQGFSAGPGPALLSVKMPNLPPPFVLRVYEAAGGIDLTTATGRAMRTFLNEIIVNP